MLRFLEILFDIQVCDTATELTIKIAGWASETSQLEDQPKQHGESLSLLKVQKLGGCGGMCLYSQLLGRLMQENCFNPGDEGCNKPRLCHCTPTWATEKDSISGRKKKG